MDIFLKVLKWIGSLVLAIIAPLLFIVVGALMIGYGGYKELQWVINSGMVVAALGVIWIMKEWLDW